MLAECYPRSGSKLGCFVFFLSEPIPQIISVRIDLKKPSRTSASIPLIHLGVNNEGTWMTKKILKGENALT